MHISRSTAYRLRQLARSEDKAELAFLDDRHGHPYKLIEPARTWLAEFCTTHPQLASSRVQAELKTTLGVTVSVSQINRVRAKLGISTQRRGTLGNVCLAGACAHLGAMVSLAGVVDPAQALALLSEKRHIAGKKERTSVLYTYPSYLGELVEYGLARNVRPADFGLECISVGGEIVTQGLKQRAERLFGSVRWLEGSGMTETWPVGGRLCEEGHLHFEVSQGLIEVQQLEGSGPVQEGEAGTLVVTPFPPYRETTLLLRYDTQDVVRVLPSALACSLKDLPATSNLLGKRGLAAHHEGGWTFPREVLEALEAVEELPLPARCGFWAVPGGVALEVQSRENTPELHRKIQDSLHAWGVPVQSLRLVEPGWPIQHALPLRCDLRELQFADRSPRNIPFDRARAAITIQ